MVPRPEAIPPENRAAAPSRRQPGGVAAATRWRYTRCGCYIRLHIEPAVPQVRGWESWLETPTELDDRRTVDKYLNYSFFLLSGLYYVASVSLAAEVAAARFGLVELSVTLGVYVALGVWVAVLIVQRAKSATTTKHEGYVKVRPEGGADPAQ